MKQSIDLGEIILRKAVVSDLHDIYDNVWSDTSLSKYMYWTPTNDLKSARQRLERTIFFQQKHDMFFIEYKDTHNVIGFAGYELLDENTMGEAGICICQKYQHQKLGKKILKCFIELAFYEFNCSFFCYTFMEENICSRNLCLSFPFKYYGVSKKLIVRDNYEYRNVVYHLSKDDYEKGERDGKSN